MSFNPFKVSVKDFNAAQPFVIVKDSNGDTFVDEKDGVIPNPKIIDAKDYAANKNKLSQLLNRVGTVQAIDKGITRTGGLVVLGNLFDVQVREQKDVSQNIECLTVNNECKLRKTDFPNGAGLAFAPSDGYKWTISDVRLYSSQLEKAQKIADPLKPLLINFLNPKMNEIFSQKNNINDLSLDIDPNLLTNNYVIEAKIFILFIHLTYPPSSKSKNYQLRVQKFSKESGEAIQERSRDLTLSAAEFSLLNKGTLPPKLN